MVKFLKSLIHYLEKIIKNPKFRYSKGFIHIKELFSYNEVEENIRQMILFVKVDSLKGDYAEFGVGERSFIPAYWFC